MKILPVMAGAALLACGLAATAQTQAACGQALDAPLKSNARITIDSRPASLEIVGSNEENIHVTCSSDDSDVSGNTRMRLTGASGDARITVRGNSGSHGGLKVRIEVPHNAGLRIEMPAGQVDVKEIIGDKDINLYAGQITISSARDWNYSSVEASVDIGQVNAPVYGANKGGFFRTVSHRTPGGEYHLHAHVMTGQIDLVGNDAHASAD